jgi:toxin ParE1/3/4
VTRKVIRSASADEDMLAIADDVSASISIDAALALDDRLDAAIESLDEMSARGRVVPELRIRRITAYRELVVAPFYRVTYRVEEREVWVVAVLDHRRDLDTVLQDRARRDRPR